MGSNRYSGWKSLGAMRPPLWLENSHHMAIFLHFLAFLVTLLAVRTTVMFTLGSERTQTLVTHVGWWRGAIFALSRYLSGAGGVQNMAILGVKIKPIWRAGSRVGIVPGKCFMSHITPKYMGQHYLGPFLPSPGTYSGQGGSKIWLFLG